MKTDSSVVSWLWIDSMGCSRINAKNSRFELTDAGLTLRRNLDTDGSRAVLSFEGQWRVDDLQFAVGNERHTITQLVGRHHVVRG